MAPGFAHAAHAPPNPIAAVERALAEEPTDHVVAYFLALLSRADDRGGPLDALEHTLAKPTTTCRQPPCSMR